MIKTEIGDICKVINDGRVYPEYDKFALDAGHLDIATERYVENGNSSIVLDKDVKVLYIGQHEYFPTIMVAIVETVDSPVYLKFMIDIEGLETTYRKSAIDSFIEDYY